MIDKLQNQPEVSSENLAEGHLLNCEICLKEIPADSGEYLETDEYVQHFCGIECYNQWKKAGKP